MIHDNYSFAAVVNRIVNIWYAAPVIMSFQLQWGHGPQDKNPCSRWLITLHRYFRFCVFICQSSTAPGTAPDFEEYVFKMLSFWLRSTMTYQCSPLHFSFFQILFLISYKHFWGKRNYLICYNGDNIVLPSRTNWTIKKKSWLSEKDARVHCKNNLWESGWHLLCVEWC